ncbi:hypothetical protein QVD99_000542 [Batrachochytrium dendrobatidis]|uniref:ABC1 atypical kinase-like domain-containing protein n=1 Tax=Batrachochytrium dendrobatidis (strain JEL423) TaxID=403673 RepID=A0A177WFJ1_BATDL|nr:hypothetical protein O5D80_008121 [Batrachochytrium dendrobatidis]KAK5673079.1 hypothetical protein QVD99_000542 [Batrachochytrium dendrobatidis]OAJ38793.1 hypothetical protein BDEG_22697 [Batrachochytrium dendrobatidis JEL423]
MQSARRLAANVATSDALSLLLAIRKVPILNPQQNIQSSPVCLAPVAIPTVDPIEPGNSISNKTEAATLVDQPIPKSSFMDNVKPRQLEPAAIPYTRIGRIYELGSLAAGVSLGMMSEAVKRATGISSESDSSSLAFSPSNVERIVEKLSKMRGAALKMGQMISIQDNRMIGPEIEDIFRRVQSSANYMPTWQLEQVLSKNLGSDWRSKFQSFEDIPLAAASIGQVHKAVLPTGETVAVKVQYPGVADSISSDLANLKSLLLFGNMLPKGLYLDNMIRVASSELSLECDYKREAAASERFRTLIAEAGLDSFYVPRVFPDLTTSRVLTTEYFQGISIDQAVTLDQKTRNDLGEKLFRLCLLELFEFRFMQTDPNWSNFLYNPATHKIALIDFGASREFPKSFTDDYLRLLHASSVKNHEECINYSRKLGFLTGYESSVMNNAHLKSLQLLSRPFMIDAKPLYDFSTASDISSQVRTEIPVMLRERLTPPPDESYSLHRKLSGFFLLCNKLESQIHCREIFEQILNKYKFD